MKFTAAAKERQHKKFNHTYIHKYIRKVRRSGESERLYNISFRKITGSKRLPMYKTNIVNQTLYLRPLCSHSSPAHYLLDYICMYPNLSLTPFSPTLIFLFSRFSSGHPRRSICLLLPSSFFFFFCSFSNLYALANIHTNKIYACVHMFNVTSIEMYKARIQRSTQRLHRKMLNVIFKVCNYLLWRVHHKCIITCTHTSVVLGYYRDATWFKYF